MRASVERLARRWWAGELGVGGAVLDSVAAPMSWAWAGAARRRAARLARSATPLEGLRVVSVGNLAVGGTGKTPVAAWVADRLREAGTATALVVGASGRDEADLHARWSPHGPVLVERDRLAAAAAARAAGARAVVLDDAFQHLRIARDLDVVLLSADDAFPGHVLPRGPYREPPEALARAHAIVVTRRRASEAEARGVAERAAGFAPAATTAGAWLAPGGLCRLETWARGGEAEVGARAPMDPVLAVCGVARPGAFVAAVGAVVDAPVDLLAFPDHHPYSAPDVARIRRHALGRPVVVTEKDAVKLVPHVAGASGTEVLGDTWVLTEELRWSWGEAELRARLDALAAETIRP